MGLDKDEVENRMALRSRKDSNLIQNIEDDTLDKTD